ncbi:MAG: hypothetical protein HY554_15120 [Elusimicrobia bacterium]|nr:hypothetical protein [Elusimicrobiota bacterium]
MGRGYRRLAAALFVAAGPAFAVPAPRPDGDPPGGGTQRLSTEALSLAHANFSGDACPVWIDVLASRGGPGPGRPREDAFTFAFRSPSLWKMRFEARVCLPHAANATPPCDGEWQFHQSRGEAAKPRCLAGRSADSAEALAVAEKHGLRPPPVDGIRLGLRQVPKSGGGLAKQAKLRGRTVWIVESRGGCHAVDAQTLEHLLKRPCSALGWKPDN